MPFADRNAAAGWQVTRAAVVLILAGIRHHRVLTAFVYNYRSFDGISDDSLNINSLYYKQSEKEILNSKNKTIIMKPVSKKQNIVIQELEKELLVYDLQNNKAFCLNETSAIIYQLCDGMKSVAEISDSMSRKIKTPVSKDFVKLALNELNRDGLLENSDDLDNYFAGVSRREMVRKVGLASMIALPLISSVVAPLAIQAQSGCEAPGTLSPTVCASSPVGCNSLGGPGIVCCSGIVVSVSQPCPFNTPKPTDACACA